MRGDGLLHERSYGIRQLYSDFVTCLVYLLPHAKQDIRTPLRETQASHPIRLTSGAVLDMRTAAEDDGGGGARETAHID
jgi:hypothetical protein